MASQGPKHTPKPGDALAPLEMTPKRSGHAPSPPRAARGAPTEWFAGLCGVSVSLTLALNATPQGPPGSAGTSPQDPGEGRRPDRDISGWAVGRHSVGEGTGQPERQSRREPCWAVFFPGQTRARPPKGPALHLPPT